MNKLATRQEMRAFICGQCHVEHYFKGPEKRLTYPWVKGLKVEQIMAYYDEVQQKDWVHADSGAPALKAQHPEFEMWNQGVHARSGVACADCEPRRCTQFAVYLPAVEAAVEAGPRSQSDRPGGTAERLLKSLAQLLRGAKE